MEFDKKVIGKKLKKVRKSKNLTQEYVAEKSNISTNQYGRIERGEVLCLLITIANIVKTLDITLDYLLFNKESQDIDDEIHKLIRKFDIVTSYYAEEVVMNYIEIKKHK